MYKKAKYNTLKLITAKNQAFFDDKLSECIGKPNYETMRKVSHILVPQLGTNCQVQWKETLA